MNNEKMAQSLGNYITVDDYLTKHSANSLRLMIWMTPWMNPVNMTDELIKQAEILEKRLFEFISNVKFVLNKSKCVNISDKQNSFTVIFEILENIKSSLHKNFSTDEVIRLLNKLITECNKYISLNEIDYVFLENILNKTNELLYIIGIQFDNFNKEECNTKNSDQSKYEIIQMIAQFREDVKKMKQYSLSDHIRDVLIPQIGYILQDTPDGYKITKILH